MKISYSVEDILALLKNPKTSGNYSGSLSNIAGLESAQAGDISFLGNPKYKNQVASTKASLVLLPQDFEGEPGDDQIFCFVQNPSLTLALICQAIEQQLWPTPKPGVHPSAVVDPTAQVDPSATVGPLCYVGAGAQVGPNTYLQAQVHVGNHTTVGEGCWFMPHATVLDYCEIGNKVRLHSGAVIGSDGYGYEFIEGKHQKVPQIGKVVIKDNVEIGANTAIDRARFADTLVDEGTKIDNLVQLGHNVRIGKHCLIIGQVGISGSTILEDNVIIGGQAGLTGHLKIGKGSMIGAQSGINHDLEPGSYVRGAPAHPYMLAHRIEILKKQLPDLFKRVSSIEKQIQSSIPS